MSLLYLEYIDNNLYSAFFTVLVYCGHNSLHLETYSLFTGAEYCTWLLCAVVHGEMCTISATLVRIDIMLYGGMIKIHIHRHICTIIQNCYDQFT